MNKSIKMLIGVTLIAILVIIISQVAFASAYVSGQASWPKYDSSNLGLGKYHFNSKASNKIDTRLSKDKYYYDYVSTPAPQDASNWGNKRVINAKEYKHTGNETYTDNYYYKPRYSQDTQSYNWRF